MDTGTQRRNTMRRHTERMPCNDQSDASARQGMLKAGDNPTELEEIRKDSLQVSERA